MADISDKAKKPSNDKQKPIRKSTRLQERVAQQSEPLDVGVPTSMDYILTSLFNFYFFKIQSSFFPPGKCQETMICIHKDL